MKGIKFVWNSTLDKFIAERFVRQIPGIKRWSDKTIVNPDNCEVGPYKKSPDLRGTNNAEFCPAKSLIIDRLDFRSDAKFLIGSLTHYAQSGMV